MDVCLSIEHLIDTHSMFMQRGPSEAPPKPQQREEPEVSKFRAKDYMDRWINPPEKIAAEAKKLKEEKAKVRRVTPARPTRDVLQYLLGHARIEDWQADCLAIVREESYYYAPQGMTKIMNEGWATYWHSTIMTRYCLRDDEVVTYADHHSGTVATSPGRLNPYKMGVELFRDIERRWNVGQYGKEWEEIEDVEIKRNW